jgi:hypothetical protein
MSGAASNKDGAAQSGMRVDAEDVDGDGLPELFVTTYVSEYGTLFQNLGDGCFLSITQNFGLAPDSAPWVKWGCALADFDNDGWEIVPIVVESRGGSSRTLSHYSVLASNPLLPDKGF